MFRIFCFVSALLWPTRLAAQMPPALDAPSPQAAAATQAADVAQQTAGPGLVGIRTNFELLLTIGIMLFGVLLALLVLYMSTRAFANMPETTSRLFTVVLMVTAVLVLITAGYSNDQIAPVFGLFGTIVGYVLGRRDTAAVPGTEEPPPAPPDAPPPGAKP